MAHPVGSILLRYGMNPLQSPARAYVEEGLLPLEILNGAPSYINLLDALTGWQLVSELNEATEYPAAASFKHVAPSGAAIGLPLTPQLARSYRVEGLELSPLAVAYARARGADRVASYGDFAALSRVVDESTALLLAREVSDGVIAPGYQPEALEILRGKRNGTYLVLRIEPDWRPPVLERRQVFGITLEQPRNVNGVAPGRVVSRNRHLPDEAQRDLLIAAITLKYTPSNSICLAKDGTTIGVGAGQQSRILCTRLACTKAETWWLLQHPQALGLTYLPGTSRTERDNATQAWLMGEIVGGLTHAPDTLCAEERARWIAGLCGVAMASDGLIPFRDNVDRAARTGVAYIWQPGGGARDTEVVAATDEYGMVMYFSGLRLFHH